MQTGKWQLIRVTFFVPLNCIYISHFRAKHGEYVLNTSPSEKTFPFS